jgi:hypothetical protein
MCTTCSVLSPTSRFIPNTKVLIAANIDEKTERKMFERAPTELKAEKQADVVQQQVVQLAMPNPCAYML